MNKIGSQQNGKVGTMGTVHKIKRKVPLVRQLAIATSKIHILERAIQDVNALLVEKSEVIKTLEQQLEYQMLMETESGDEAMVVPCLLCKVPILTWWAPDNQGMLRGEYVLVGDCVLHPKCFDKWYAEADKVFSKVPLLNSG
jgi:hypothetical protein